MRKLTLSAVALACLLLPNVASGYTRVSTSGYPGRDLTIYQIQGSHYNPCSTLYPCFRTYLYSGGPIVSRSPRTSGLQTVRTEYLVYIWSNGAWAYQTKTVTSGVIRRGYSSAQVPGLSVLPPAGRGYYSLFIRFHWYNRYGKWLGRRSIDMNHSGDYGCYTYFPCEAGPGWVYLGGTFGFARNGPGSAPTSQSPAPATRTASHPISRG